jgi:hypothetical protein
VLNLPTEIKLQLSFIKGKKGKAKRDAQAPDVWSHHFSSSMFFCNVISLRLNFVPEQFSLRFVVLDERRDDCEKSQAPKSQPSSTGKAWAGEDGEGEIINFI